MFSELAKALVTVSTASVFIVTAAAQQNPPQTGTQAPAAPTGQTAGQAPTADPTKPADASKPAAAGPKKEWTDRAEYDLVQEIEKAPDANKRLALLEQWTQKYPQTQFKTERMQYYLATYQQLGQGAKMIEVAKQIVAEDPNNLLGLSWLNLLTVSMNNTAADALATGEKAAQQLLSNLDAIYAADKKPEKVDDATWAKNKKESEALAHTTLGWVHMARKNPEGAEQEFLKSLQAKPNNAQVSYWLGGQVLAQKKVEKQAPALFHFARAAALEGQPPDAFPADQRKKVEAYLEKIYVQYHGDKSGLPELMASAKTTAIPPPDLKIASKIDLENEKAAALAKDNPQLAMWLNLKTQLAGEGGQQYFESNMKGAGVDLKGKVVSHSPATRPKTVQVAIENPAVADVTLVFEEPLSGKAEPGTEIEFKGVPTSFTTTPFMITMEADKENLKGWPAAAPAGKKSGGAKKGGGKKR